MATKPTAKHSANITFHDHLVLNRWLLSLFHKQDLPTLKAQMGGDDYEGLAQDGQSKFFHQLTGVLFFGEGTGLSEADLRRYDLNVVRHWQTVTARRNKHSGHELQMKYFQYLSLIFSEIYLDWYFNRRDRLLAELNDQLNRYRENLGIEAKNFSPYAEQELNKIAFWNATGSGKTLLMHVNILQYLSYFSDGTGRGKPDKIIVLTPNEGLSRQHVAELALSGFQAALFDKNGQARNYTLNIDDLNSIEAEVIDVNKLADKAGDKTVAAEHFAGNNLVLVDEGHRGSSGEEWLKRRDVLVRGGFSFEYSATLGQAAGKGKTLADTRFEQQKKNALAHFGVAKQSDLSKEQKSLIPTLPLTPAQEQTARQTAVMETYAKTVLFDYSYKFFYADGYGKDSLILNLKNEGDYFAQHEKLYFTACLLSFYQQMYLFENHQGRLNEWQIEKPLMVFVGNTVSGEDSDILKLAGFLAFFLNEPQQVQQWLDDLVADKAQLVDKNGRNIFLRRFAPLTDFSDRAADLYADMLQRVFHAPSPARLRLDLLKKGDGELALRVGGNAPFGMINIGNAAGLLKAAENHLDFDSGTDEFSDGLFDKINTSKSSVNLLIGSRKFTEGWSSWRVSTMGLLNMGKSEGSQIIQLFGRGVRLKGRGFSLKRSLPQERPKGVFLEKLETLNIFGVNADYMDKFREYLAEEGVDLDEVITLDFKVQPNLPKGVKLKTLKLDAQYQGNRENSFKRTQKVDLFDVPEQWQGKIKTPHAVLDLFPQIDALATKGAATVQTLETQKRKSSLNAACFAFFDWDKIYLTVQHHKHAKSWYNLRLDKGRLKTFAESNHWYTLLAPERALAVQDFADVLKQEKWLTDLLLLYVEDFYARLKAAYEGQFYETVWVDEHNGSMLENYVFEIEGSDAGGEYHQKLEDLKIRVESGELKKVLGWSAPNVEAICFDPHLFYPIIVLEKRDALPFTMKPLALGAHSEVQFVQDLQAASASSCLKEWTQGKDLYLLRNAANKAKGLGFALAGNFYPDFLLWLVDKESGRQWLTFIDPKGIRKMAWNDPKFGLFEEVKKLEQSLALNLTLNSFILAVTPSEDTAETGALAVFGKSEAEFAEKHILFMDKPDYLQKMFAMILSDEAV